MCDYLRIFQLEYAYNQMNQKQLERAVSSLETFLQLKMQNLQIHSWIQIKKHSKNNLFTQRTRNDTFKNMQLSEYINYEENQPHKQSTRPPKLLASHLNQFQTQRRSKQVEGFNRNEELFHTFNKHRNNNKLSPSDNQTYVYQPSHKIKLETNYYQDAQDSDQFEDIVLDRLSKLQQNISKLMAENKTKENRRSYLEEYLQYKPYNMQDDQGFYYESAYEREMDRKIKNFYLNQSDESRKVSPVHDSMADIIYNLKYIPIPKKDSVNIYKIRELIDAHHHQGQNQYLGNVDVFNPTKQSVIHRNFYINGGRTHSKGSKSGCHTREKGSSTLYFNRYQGFQTIANGNQVHFMPKNIEMQTVIQSSGKYPRNNSNKNMQIRNRENDMKDYRKVLLKGKASAISNSSQNSYFSSSSEVGYNRSALY